MSYLLTQWRSDGCVTLPALLDSGRATRIRTLCDHVLAQWSACDPQTGQPGAKPDATVMRHLNHPAYFTQRPAELAELLAVAADPAVLRIVEAVFGEAPMFRCTSLFFNPSGISLDGNWHRDSQFTHRDDAAEWEMLRTAGENGAGMQMQIALLPSDDIEIVPGSHLRWDTPAEYAIRKADDWAHNRSNAMPGAQRMHQNAGDAVLFNPNALHRGRYRSEIPRRTLMLTYTRRSEPCSDFFSAQPWFLEPGYLHGLDAHSQHFYDEFVAQYRADWQK
ncbi:MAG: phytanoyl-CoA dioxygenase family protein [Chloroflexi bacterium]|nr:phytanoyl-CoA dioxygenase family protein [Chloroflexota bacterium]